MEWRTDYSKGYSKGYKDGRRMGYSDGYETGVQYSIEEVEQTFDRLIEESFNDIQTSAYRGAKIEILDNLKELIEEDE